MDNDNNSKKENNENKNRDSWNRKYTLIAIYAFIVIVVSFVFVLFIMGVRDFFIQKQHMKILKILTPVTFGFVFAYLLNPLLIFFQNKIFSKLKKNIKNTLSIISTYLSAAIVITLVLLMVIPQVISSVQQLTGIATDWFNPYLSTKNTEENNNDSENENNENSESEDILEVQIDIVNSKIGEYLANLGESIQDYIDGLGLKIDVEETIDSISENLLSLITAYITPAVNSIASFGAALVSGVFNIILGILISIYLLIGKDKFIAQVKKILFAIVPARFSYKIVEIMRKTHEIFGKYITGKLLDAVIVGIICFTVMSIFNIRYAALISVIIAISNLIPFFGPFIGAIPSIFFLAIHDIWQALFFLIFILVLQQIDGNIIDPKIVGSKVGLPTFWVVFSIIVSGGLFGIPGVFFGVPVFAVAYVLIKEYAENKLKIKGFPTETEQYIRTPGSKSDDELNYSGEDLKKTNKDTKDSNPVFFGRALNKTAKKIMGIFNKNSKHTDDDHEHDHDDK